MISDKLFAARTGDGYSSSNQRRLPGYLNMKKTRARCGDFRHFSRQWFTVVILAATFLVGVVVHLSAQTEHWPDRVKCEGTFNKAQGWMSERENGEVVGTCKFNRADVAAILRICGEGPCEVWGIVKQCPVECNKFIRVKSIRRVD